MKKPATIALMLLLQVFVGLGQPLAVATYNLRGDDPRDVGNEWSARKYMVSDQIRRHKLDLIGIQETNVNMVADLMSTIPDLDSIGAFTKVTTGILYNKRRLALLDHGNFYLSATPDQESKGWDAKFKRMCVWGSFKDRLTGHEYTIFNSHFDHVGVMSRTNSIELLLEKSKQIAGNADQILMGDLNTTQYDSNYLNINNSGLFKDCYNLALNNREKLRGTGNGFNIHRRQRIRVDHIFLSGKLQSYEYNILTELYNEHTASDHYAVMSLIGPKTNDLGDLYRQFPEDFENITTVIPRYGNIKVRSRTGEWLFKGGILGGSIGNDRPTSGNHAVRLINNNPEPVYLQMNFDVPEGASRVTVQHGIYAADSACRWQLEYSTNQGRTWKETGPVVVSHQAEKQQAIFVLDITGKVRFRIKKMAGTENNGRLSIDDFTIYKRSATGPERVNVPLLAWQFSPFPDQGAKKARSSFNAKGIEQTVFKRGAGLSAFAGDSSLASVRPGFTVVAGKPVRDTSEAILAESFFEFTVQVANRFDAALQTLDLRAMSTGTVKKIWYWKYSLDGKSFRALAKPFEFTDSFASSQTTIDLSVNPDLQHLTNGQQVYFRLYVAGLEGRDDLISIGSVHRDENNESGADYALILTGLIKKK